MAATKQLAAAVRSGIGKGAARAVRREGRVPGVIYGGGVAAEPISLDFRETNKLIYAGHFLTTIFELDIEGRKERVIPRDYQLDVVKDMPLHVDFMRLRAGSRLRLAIPVHLTNADQAPGIKRGGTLNIVRHTVDMLVPADNIPDSITADLAGLDINNSLHISAIKLPPGCQTLAKEGDFTVVTIAAPSGLAEAVAADAAAAESAAAKAAAPKGKAAPAKAAPAGGKAPAAAAKPAAKPAGKK
jgi:large subunit ribosomal protein L25